MMILLIYIAAACSSGVKYARPPVEIPAGYELAWSDEFNGNGSPDSSAWSHETGFSRNEELQWYQPENATCRDGLLVITARVDSKPNPWFTPGSRDWKRERERVAFTSSCIKTVGKKEFLYGRFEIRARIPVASGAWPAIWTLGKSMPWPSNGEIDIMEYYRIKNVPHLLANTAWGTDTPWNARWDSATIPFSSFTGKDPGWAGKFHVWRMDWDEEAIRLYVDDELLNETLLTTTRNGSVGNYTNPFHQPHYILLNLAIGKNGGEPDLSAFPLVYEVDYVRVFQKKK
jgi:beta-glucanase (GH16 family)